MFIREPFHEVRMDIKKEYGVLAKKYRLPDYERLDREFEILYVVEIKEIKYISRFIRRRINDKIAWACTMIQSILQPNPGSLVNLQESSSFSKEDKQNLYEVLKGLMQFERRSLALDIQFDEGEDAVFITEAYNKWMKIKEDLAAIAEKMYNFWKSLPEEKKPNDHYFG